MQVLESYIAGRWHRGSGKPTELVNPARGETVAHTSSGGLDFAAAARHGREVGGPALRALSFAARGELLKRVSAALHENRDELIELSTRNGGNTRSDAKFDIDGAIGTLAAYAAWGKELGDRTYLADGEGVQLGRSPRFFGQHVSVARHGVAVHVNAFNFPAWGTMEKAACALLAGVPVLTKPASSTALLAWRITRIVIDSGILPEGAFQFIAGSVGDLFDHLGPQDCVAFTGSSKTAESIRSHANLIRAGVRINIEADSLNAAVLGPDVDASSATYGLFLSNVVLDMTQKAGQKCTAVRRIFVPAERLDEVRSDLTSELERIRVGDPAQDGVRMGPLSSAAQLDDVKEGIGRLSAAADLATGSREDLPAGGAFVAPTLLVARDVHASTLHELEVFGPVATLFPYDGTVEEAVDLVRRGGGGLVTSVYSNDSDWTTDFVLQVAPWQGRIWIGSDKMAEQSLPPGMVLPSLVHGGPGRAGAGEELGAERGLAFYMQRVALQGFKGYLEGLVRGTAARQSDADARERGLKSEEKTA